MIVTITIVVIIASFTHIAWHNFKLAIILLAGLLPTYLIRLSIGPFPYTLLELLTVILISIWLIRINKKTILQIKQNIVFKPILLLLASASFGVVVSPDIFSALGIWKAYFIEPALIFFIITTSLSQNDRKKIICSFSISAILVSIIAITQYMSGLGIPTAWILEKRVTGVFDYPNALGLFLAPIVTMSIVLLINFKNTNFKKFQKPVIFLTVILGIIGILLAKTEAGLVAIPTALLTTLLFSNIKKSTKINTLAVSILFTIGLISFVPVVKQKIFLQDYSGQVRLSQWSETWQMLKTKPIFGAGLNSYPQALKPFHDSTFYEIFQYPHNILLNIWTELGFLGIISFFWISFIVIKKVVQQSKEQDAIKLAIFGAMTTMVVHGIVDVPFFKNDLSMMTFILLSIFFIENKNRASAVHDFSHTTLGSK